VASHQACSPTRRGQMHQLRPRCAKRRVTVRLLYCPRTGSASLSSVAA